MAIFLLVLGVAITLSSFAFALYNMYNAVDSSKPSKGFDALYKRHILSIAGVALGTTILFIGGILTLMKMLQ